MSFKSNTDIFSPYSTGLLACILKLCTVFASVFLSTNKQVVNQNNKLKDAKMVSRAS